MGLQHECCRHFAITYWLKCVVCILNQKTAAPKVRTSTCRSQGPQACLCFGLAKPHTAECTKPSRPQATGYRLRATCIGEQLGPSRQTATWITDTERQQQPVCRIHKSWLNCALWWETYTSKMILNTSKMSDNTEFSKKKKKIFFFGHWSKLCLTKNTSYINRTRTNCNRKSQQ